MTRSTLSLTLGLLIAGLLIAPAALAERCPCGDLLLPYFEVQFPKEGTPEGGAGWYRTETTLYAVSNRSDEPARVLITVWTNWGIPVVDSEVVLEPGEVLSSNLRDLLFFGQMPGRDLDPPELAHLRAALRGWPSPLDGRYYSTEVAPDRAAGFVTFDVLGRFGTPADRALWGDFFVVDPRREEARGESLVRMVGDETRELCERHLIRFLASEPDATRTKFVFWTGVGGSPSATPEPNLHRATAQCEVFAEDGTKIADETLDLLAAEAIDVGSLGWPEPAGWVDCDLARMSFLCVEHNAAERFDMVLRSFCMPEEARGPRARPGEIDIEKLTNGQDADLAPGVYVGVGSTVEWTYLVTNTGRTTLTEVVVEDDKLGVIPCPASELLQGESMTCTASGIGTAGPHRNLATVTARDPRGRPIRDSDPSNCFGVSPGIHLEKATNGHDADLPPGPMIPAGSIATWTYRVTNTSTTPLTDVTVTDDQGVTVTCPATELAPGASMTCVASGTVGAGQYTNRGQASGTAPDGTGVSSYDWSHCFGVTPEIDIEKATNGQDADLPPGPMIPVGSPVSWEYVVTNTSNVTLTGLVVTDDQVGAVACPATELAPGASMTCSATGVMAPGQYANVGVVDGTAPDGSSVADFDLSHCYGMEATLGIEKYTEGHDADLPPGPSLPIGDPVEWTYVVTNHGNVALTGIVVTDDQGVVVTCPGSALDPGASMTCTGAGTMGPGQYVNLGTVTASAPEGTEVSVSDPSHCYGIEAQEGGEGCTPGYWKNHPGSWALTGYTTDQHVSSVFPQAAAYPGLGSATLMAALNLGGGGGLEGGAEILLRAAVAALLNAAHPNVSYPLTPVQVISQVDLALASADRDTMLLVAAELDTFNNLGCPLS